MARAAHDDEVVVEFCDPPDTGLDVVAQRHAHALEHCAVQMCAAVVQAEADEAAAGLRVPHRAAFAHQIGQEQQAVGARRQRRRIALEQRMRVDVLRQAGSDLGLTEVVAEPGDRGARRTCAAEHVQVVCAAKHVRHADQALACVYVLSDRSPAHAGADHRDVVARPRRASGERCDGCIDAARHHRRTGNQPELRSPIGAQQPCHRARIDQPCGHHSPRNAEHLQRLVGPVALGEVVDAADVAGRAVVDGDLAGELGDHKAVGRQEVRGALPHRRHLLSQPQHLRVAVIAVHAVAGDRHQTLDVDVCSHPCHFILRTPVHPDQAGVKRGAFGVDRNAAATVKTADAQRLDRGSVDTCLGQHAADARSHRVEPDAGPLLCPQRLRRLDLIGP